MLKMIMVFRTAFTGLILALLLLGQADARKLHPEKWYQERWCAERGGQVEVVLPDLTRCDCLTTTNAVEVDFGPKWAEAVGQALYYSVQTGRKAGIVLILESPEERKYWIRLNSVVTHYNLPIDTWAYGAGASKAAPKG